MIASPPNSLSGTKKPATEENNTSLSSSSSNVPRAKKQSPVLLLVGLCCIISGFFNIVNAHWLHGASSSSSSSSAEAFHKSNIFHRNHGAGRGGAIQHAMREFLKGKEGLQTTSRKKNRVENISYTGESQVEHDDEVGHQTLLGQTKIVDHGLVWGDATHPNTLATLSCEAHGGPTTEEAQEMVYWHDIPSDTKYKSPLFQRDGVERFLTFEPDGGGWNNIRMAMETVIGLAIATGRTLVLPPQQRMYLLGKDRGKQRTDFDFDHFFPIYDMAAENDGLSVITMKDFLERVAMKGEMRNKETGEVEYPPEMRTDWDGQDVKILKEWLRNVTHTPLWSPGQCLAAFPSDASTEAVDRLHHHLIKARSKPLKNPIAMEHPPSVDSPPEYRLRENLAGRKELCIYDTQMQKETVIHFMCYHKMRVRMLVHFYAFLFFEDYREDLWMKRFMRDHIRYKDPIQCAAARIVSALRKEFGEFDTFHVRRGDFQFKRTRISAEEIYENVKDIIPEGRALFIATDERDKKFFDPLKKHYKVRFLDDYKNMLEGVNTNFYGMIDQLVASRGKLFFGCWHSTFTGFIARMRGYHSVNHREPGYEDGRLPTTYYYVPMDNQNIMHRYSALYSAFFNREFPSAWRDIDASTGDVPIGKEKA